MIRVSEPLLTEAEVTAAAECVSSGWISSAGPALEEFERAWAGICGVRHGVAVSNGTVALELAVSCLDLDPGDEVILPTFTIISCAQAILRNGLVPVLVDSRPDTWCMDVDRVAERIGPRTRAVMPVHIYGHPVEMEPLLGLARSRGLAVVEDAAEAHGAECLISLGRSDRAWRRCGGIGQLGVFSFYANKPVTTGEGGMLVTDLEPLAERALARRNLCFGDRHRFLHQRLGYNFRLTGLQASLGLAQVRRFDHIVEGKRGIARAYLERLSGLSGIQLPCEAPWARSIYWMFGLVFDESTGLDAAGAASRLEARGIETRPFFQGMHQQPVFLRTGLFQGERYPVAERLARQGLYLPSGLGLTEQQIDQVAAAVRDLVS